MRMTNRFWKGIVFSTLLISILFSSVFAQQSDYAIRQNFNARYEALLKEMETMFSLEQIDEMNRKIAAFEAEFVRHKAMLDEALYPESFDKRIKLLQGQAQLLASKADTLRAREERIAQLEGQVETLTAENSRLFAEVGRLKTESTTNKQMIDSLQNVISRLRANIAQRDQLIFAMVDSIFLQAGKDVKAMTDKERKTLGGKLEKRNFFAAIKKAISENLTFLGVTTLTGQDFSALVPEQRRFSSQWKGLGPKLADIYLEAKNRKKEVATIDTLVAQWGNQLDAAMWKTLETLFATHGFVIGKFASGTEFVNAAIVLIDGRIDGIQKNQIPDYKKEFEIFIDSVWSTQLKPIWKPILVHHCGVTEEHFKSLEAKVEAWEQLAAPSVSIWVYIIGVIVIVALVVILISVRKKRVIAPPPAP